MLTLRLLTIAAITAAALTSAALADGVLQYGDADVLGTGTYASDPTAGATLSGLAPNTVSSASLITPHGFPFSPDVTDYPGTDQIYVGSVQTGAHDGYSGALSRLPGPQIITLDYSSLVPAGATITSLTLGIATDDFQNAVFGQPFTASINGIVNPTLTATLNGLDETTPVVRFLSIGIDPAALDPTGLLTLSINEGGDGGDGWAIDFLTVGVTTNVPAPGAAGVLAMAGMLAARRKR